MRALLTVAIVCGLLLWAIILSGCETTKLAPPPPAPPDLCTFYTPWQMSPPAAAVETVPNLRAHAGNNAAHYDKCIAANPKLDPARPGGPR